MKQRKHLKVILMLVILISFLSTKIVQAENLFDGSKVFTYTPKTSDGRLEMSCYDYNVKKKTDADGWKGVVWWNALNDGQGYWNSADKINGISPNTIVDCKTTASGKAHIWYAVPDVKEWEKMVPSIFEQNDLFAITVPCDTDGLVLYADNYTSSNGYIRSANIYFNPELASSYVKELENANVAKKATVAHELGHVIGMGHVTNRASIMQQGLKSYTQLQGYDMTWLILRYQ